MSMNIYLYEGVTSAAGVRSVFGDVCLRVPLLTAVASAMEEVAI